MKKLYALLVILIVIYAGINLSANGLDTINQLSHVNIHNLTSVFGQEEKVEGITVGSSVFVEIENFTSNQTNDTSVTIYNSKNGMYIHVEEIDSSINLEDIVSNMLSGETTITSNQTISQNGITAYFLYEEGEDDYNAYIYFSKDNKNYLITGESISYDDSDFFINTCKDIINSIESDGGINYSRY